MPGYVYWLLLSVLEEFKGDKKEIREFGAKLGYKLAEELSFAPIPLDTLIGLVAYSLPSIGQCIDHKLQCTEETDEIRVSFIQEAEAISEDKMEMASGILSAIIERILNRRIRIKSYYPSALLIVQSDIYTE